MARFTFDDPAYIGTTLYAIGMRAGGAMGLAAGGFEPRDVSHWNAYKLSPTADDVDAVGHWEWETPASWIDVLVYLQVREETGLGAKDPLVGSPAALQLGSDGGEVVFAAVKAKTDLLGTAEATLESPFDAAGVNLNLVIGADYAEADGRSLAWTSTAWSEWVGRTATLTVRSATSQAVLFAPTAVMTETDGVQRVAFDLTAAQTALFVEGPKTAKFDVWVTNLAGRKIPLVPRRWINVTEKVAA